MITRSPLVSLERNLKIFSDKLSHQMKVAHSNSRFYQTITQLVADFSFI